MDTTVQISNELLKRLKNMKVYSRESYESIIWDLIEDRLEFSEQTKLNLKKSEEEVRQGQTVSFEEVKKKLVFKCIL